MNTILIIIATALLTSFTTLLIGYLLFQHWMRDRIDQEVEEAADLIRRKVEEGVEAAAVDLLPEFREEVRCGMTEAADSLMPEFREEVRLGFKQALVESMSGDLIDKTARNVVEKSAGIVGEGLGMIFGKSKRDQQP